MKINSIFGIYPNPASSYIMLDCKHPLAKAAEWSLSDAMGQIVKIQSMLPGAESNSILIADLPNGIYFWKA